MAQRTQLHITGAVKALAEAHDAYLDKELGMWFIDGEVPGPLISYIVKTPRHRDYVSEVVPQCKCGSHMVIRKNGVTGQPFWACASLKCPGRASFESVALTDPAERKRSPSAAAAPQFEDKVRAAGVVTEAIHRFGNEGLATNWLKSPKVGLHGETPLEAIKSVAGCKVVERLLDERFA